MLTYDKARKMGVDACIDRLGREFVLKNRDSSSAAYGDRGDHVYCFVGVDDQPKVLKEEDGLVLTSDNSFPYVARCNVDYVSGEIKFLECVLPYSSD